MKSVWQSGTLIVVLMCVVAGTAYIIQYTSGAKAPKKEQKDDIEPPPRTELMAFPWGRIAVWRKDLGETLSAEQDTKKYLRYVEPLTDYFYDFSFYSAQNQPVTLSLASQSCTCGRVESAIFPEQDWTQWQQERPALAAEARAGTP